MEYIGGVVERLSQKQDVEREEYLNDWEQQAVVERTFQAAIEACLDIAGLLLKELDEEIPPTNAKKFSRLRDCGVLDSDIAARMQATAGFRNVLAHNYGHEIDNELVYMHLQKESAGFRPFSARFASSSRTDRCRCDTECRRTVRACPASSSNFQRTAPTGETVSVSVDCPDCGARVFNGRYVEGEGVTPMDALHLVHSDCDPIVSSEPDYDGFSERIASENDGDTG